MAYVCVTGVTEDSYLGNITDPLTLNQYNYVKSNPLNYIDSSGRETWEETLERYMRGMPVESRQLSGSEIRAFQKGIKKRIKRL